MNEPRTHYFKVRLSLTRLSTEHPDTLEFSMPAWTPGSYLVRDFAKNVRGVRAYDSDTGRSLKVTKKDKSTWAVHRSSACSLSFEYEVYAFEPTVDTSYLDQRHAVVNGASIFVYPAGISNQPSVLRVVRHEPWNVISTGLKMASSDSKSWSFEAADYDVLIDSPIEIGNQEVHTFVEGGTKYEVSIFDPFTLDNARLVEDLKKIVHHSAAVFRLVPFERYVFLIDVTSDSSGGLEHLNSTLCTYSYLATRSETEYRRSLGLFSHEFFHAWNVKRMRPEGLGPFDYSREVYTRSLWVAEGLTSYYGELLLRRSNILSVEEYLDSLCDSINQMISLPGSRWQSAEEGSFDSWIKHYRRNETDPNSQLSYYTQGTVIGALLDLQIRRNTGCAKTLDDVMREVYKGTYLEKAAGYTEEEFQKVCEEIGGEGISEIFERRVRGRELVDYSRYLSYAGLKLSPKQKPSEVTGFLGLKATSDAGRVVVREILAGSAAEEAGLAPDDEIIAVDKLRVDLPRFSYLIKAARAGVGLGLAVSRKGVLIDLQATVADYPALENRIIKTETATQEQKRVYSSWIGAEWDTALNYQEHLESPVRRRPFDFI